MDVWGWIVLYVLLFVFLQFLLYRYMRDKDSAPLQSAPANFDPSMVDERLEDPREEPDPDDGRRRCGHCGAANESSYTYCRNCVNPLMA